MSYEYLVIRPSDPSVTSMEFEEAEPAGPIGTVDEVKAAISKLFPSVQWKLRESPLGSAWFGRGGPPEFQVGVDADAMVTNFMMSHATPDEVQALVASMGLAALDLQAETVIVGGGD